MPFWLRELLIRKSQAGALPRQTQGAIKVMHNPWLSTGSLQALQVTEWQLRNDLRSKFLQKGYAP